MSISTLLKHFRKICSIPHCSYEADEMREYLVICAEEYGYQATTDAVGNILVEHPAAKMTLQAHYDMVCIGTTFPLELYEEEGWIEAENSTLGADNGMGMAMMLSMMEAGVAISCLFSADEEVGLLGVRGLELPIKTPYLLNLDSEEEGVVTIGCAGGVDIIASKPLLREKRRVHLYEYHIEGLSGGHSGVDIDKNIPNAITLLFQKLCSVKSYIVEVNGGERRNSIPKKADVLFGLETKEVLDGMRYLGEKEVAVMGESCKVIEMLADFDTGVRTLNSHLDIVETSINLALIESSEKSLRVQLSGRSMKEEALISLEKETKEYFKKGGFEVESEGFYAPWTPEENTFSEWVLEESKKIFPQAHYGAIHAGLECGIIKEKAPHLLMASIGPDILYPHSNREKVSLASVERVYESLKNIVKRVNAV